MLRVAKHCFAAFKYLTPKKRLTHEDLSPSLLRSKSIHLICSPLRCIDLVQGVKALRKALDSHLPDPLFIWEPVPDLCVPSELENTIKALGYVDVISPNHAELASLFSVDANTATGEADRQRLEDCSSRLLESVGKGKQSEKPRYVVVRSGKDGCCVASEDGTSTWLPAYHRSSPQKVVDPTGGGNGFLGGFAVGLVRTGNVATAAIWGNVAASFCIEQVGTPTLTTDEHGQERWNGVVVSERLDLAVNHTGYD